MKKFGIVSYNIYGNFTNYGSVLQSWALTEVVNRFEGGNWQAEIVDYCPDILLDKDPLNPINNMWDLDEETRKLCKMSMPAIKENYKKFDRFYSEKLIKTKKIYTSKNFNAIIKDEHINGFICGSDTIFNINEYGIDDGYFSNYDCMKNGYTFAYAASFGDAQFDDTSYKLLNERLQNFKALGIREQAMIPYLKEHTNVEVQKVLDPTLLLEQKDYDKMTYPKRLEKEKYLLLYARRRNDKMTEYADKIANENGWKVIDISLQATNVDRHRMFYEAGIEEFLSLVKNAEYIVTNSFHGMIFSVQFRRNFVIFLREQCNTKITELLALFGLSDRILVNGDENFRKKIDYEDVFRRIQPEKEKSLKFLKENLEKCDK